MSVDLHRRRHRHLVLFLPFLTRVVRKRERPVLPPLARLRAPLGRRSMLLMVYSGSGPGPAADRCRIGGGGGGAAIGGGNNIRRVRDRCWCAARPLQRLERSPPCTHARRHVLRRADFTPARRHQAPGAVERLCGRCRAAAAAPRQHRRVALVWVVHLVRLMVVGGGHLAARAADGNLGRSGVGGNDRIGWPCIICVQEGEWFSAV